MSVIRTYNVEAGLPTLDEARRLVIEEIKRAKREGRGAESDPRLTGKGSSSSSTERPAADAKEVGMGNPAEETTATEHKKSPIAIATCQPASASIVSGKHRRVNTLLLALSDTAMFLPVGCA